MKESEFIKRRNKANGIIGAVKETSSKKETTSNITQAQSVNSRRTTPPKSSSPTTTKMSESQFIKRRNIARYRKLGVSEKMGGIVDTALGKEWANTPYVWGGTSTKGADCSGFVQSVFKQNGVNLSRTTSTQINDGTPVDLKDLKIGDLVFYGKGSPSHVGIYIGNGLVRHSGGGDERNTASNPGKGVQTSPINYRSDFYGARRIDTGDAVPVEEPGATKNNGQKKTGTFLDDTSNAYSKAKDKVKNKNVVVNSNMSENERKARIKEIDDELKRIGAIRMGFRRGGGVSDSVVAEYEEKAKKLQQEKKSLEDVGKSSQNESQSAKKDTDPWWEIAGNTIMSGLGTFNKQLASTLDFILPTEVLGKYDYVSKLNDYYSNQDNYYKEKKSESLEGANKATRLISDIGESTVAALPNAILALMSAGLSAPATLGTTAASNSGILATVGNTAKQMIKNPQYWTSIAQTLGTDYEEAKKNGANEFVATSSAILKSAINAGIEIGGGIETLPQNLKSGNRKAIVQWVTSMLDEGKEEVVQGLVSNSVDKLMFDFNKDLVSLEDENALINPKRMATEFGMGAAVGGILGGGQIGLASAVNRFANAKTIKEQNDIADFIIQDEETLTALIDEGKASGEGTVSYDIAEEIEASREKGKVTRGQVKRLIASNEIYIANEEATEQDTLEGAARYVVENREQSDDIGRETRNTPTHTGFGSLSHEEVKQASGFGDNGARLLTEVASEDGMTFFKARDAIKGAYFAGYTGNDIAVRNDLERQAKLAGIDDRIADNNIAKENALNTKIYKGTFTENEYTANWSKATKRMVSTVAKSFGMDVATVDKIISEGVNGEKTEANASHINGKMVISKNADPQKTIHALVLHESGHRMEQFATDEWNTLANYLYNRAEQMDRRVKLGNYKGMEFDAVKGEHDNAGILMSTEGYVGEIAVRELETIFESPEEFNKWYAEISGNPQVRTAWEKIMDFITELIDDIKKAISNARMTKAERAETRKSVAELERIKELYTEAYKATERAVEERKTAQNKQGNDKNSEKNLEIKTNEEYNENISYSLKDNGKSEQYGVMWTLESGVLNKSEVSAFYNKISEMRNNKYKNYKISRDGNYIFEIGNKLVYTDGYYASPAIYDVITFDTNDETILGDARRFIYDAEETGASQETTLEIIEVIYGEAFARATSFEDSRTDEGKNGRREGTDSRENSSRDENGINKYFSLKGTDINTKDRQQLLDTIEQLKHEFEVTKFAKADSKKLTKMTKNILKEYSSYADFDETFNAIDALYQYMANGEDGHPAVWEDVYNRAYEIAQGIVKEALVVDDYMYQEYKSLRNYLRTTPMKFDSDYDSSPIAYDDFNSFRKSNFGRLKFSKNGLPIDAVYKELSHLYPEFFNEERDNNTADQLERIVDVLDEIQPTDINPFDREFEQVSMYLANDITSRFFDIPQAKPTFADKAERRVVQANIKGAKKVEAVRQQRDEKIKKTIEIQKEKTKKKLDKIREQRDEKVKKEQQKRIEAISKMSENQKAKVYRARIERHASDLSKKLISPTDKQHIPDELQGAVAKLLECINLESNYTYDTESHSYKKNDDGLPSKRTKAFEELRKLYKNIADSVVVDPDLMGEDGLLSDVIVLADKRIVDMNSSELDTVWNALRAVEASVSNANKMFSKGKYETISEVAETLRKDNAGKKEQTEYKGVIGKSKRLATLYMLTPETYLHQLGSAGDSIFRMMRDAQDKHISIMKEVADFTNKTLKGINVNSLEKTLHTVKLGGESIQLSTAQLMELYVLMKREQAVEHILVGGILPDVTEGKWLKQNTKAKPVRNISVDEISTATAKLTDEQKKIADKLQRYVSDVLSAYGNEASMKVYNYEKFLEKNYWPIRTNKQEINTEIGKNTSVTSVAGKGMAKGTKPHANTSVRIGSIFDSFSAHSSDMATYAAWLGTSEDVNRIRNFVFWEKGARKGTVKDILDTVHGMEGSNYLEKLLTDIAIGVKGTDNMNPFDKVIGNYKAASVGGNIRVVIQQPTAILRAMDMINACYLAEGAVKPLKGWEKAKKYAPIAQWKSWGYFDINTGRQMKDILFNNASFIENTKQVGMWGASMADSLAWGQLWNAVAAETKAKHKDLEAGSEEYYETVTKRFTEIVDHTQVVDGILQRSQIMRSPDMLTKMATSFMGEPTKQYNMAVSAAYDAMNTKGDARKKAIVRLGRTAMSLAVASIVNACAQSIIDAMRDNDKEKRYWEKWLTALVGDGEDTKLIDSNLGEAIIPFNYVPFFKDIVSIMQGYDVKRMDAEAIIKTISAVTNMIKAVAGTSKYTVAEASAQLFAEIARLFGVPVSNVKRDTKSLVMSIATATDSYILQYRIEKAMLNINYAGNRKNFMEILFNAYNNDREAYQLIYYDMIESGYDSDKIKSGLESRMKNAEGVKSTSDLSKRYMTPTDEKKYDSSMRHIQSNDLWKTATEEQRKGVKADLYNFLTSDSDYMSKTREETKAAGVDETEYILWKLAIEMADQPKGKEGSGYYDYKEKAEAINSLDLGDEEIAYFFGRGLNEYAKQELIKVQNDGIDLNTYVNFKAATSDMEADKDANGKSVPNSKKKKIVNYLNSADLTDEEWQYFYYEIMKYKR